MPPLKRTAIIILILSFPLICIGQDMVNTSTSIEESGEDFNIRPFRVGLKVGFPNTVGVNLEYATPLLGKKLSLSLDYSKLKSSWFSGTTDAKEESDDYNYSFFGAGLNYYFFKPGKGLYSGLSFGRIGFEGQSAVTKYDGNSEVNGTEYFDFINNSINLKVGARWGGLFYFRPEIGYSFNPIPDIVDSVIIYADGTRENETYSLEDQNIISPLLSGFIFNIGFGFAF